MSVSLAFDWVEKYAPGFKKSVVGRDILAPPDLERIFGLTGGVQHTVDIVELSSNLNVDTQLICLTLSLDEEVICVVCSVHYTLRDRPVV